MTKIFFATAGLVAAAGFAAAADPVTGVWMQGPGDGYAKVYRCDVTAAAQTNVTFDLSADLRYTLLLDGEIVGRGPDHDIVSDWTYRTYSFPLAAGRHRFEAVVYHGGPKGYKPLAQETYAPGLFVRGLSSWRVASLGRNAFDYGGAHGWVIGGGLPNIVHGSSPEFRALPDAAFVPVSVFREVRPPNLFRQVYPGWRLRPAPLPPQTNRPFVVPGTSFPVTVPAGTEREIVIELDDYYTAYPDLTTVGGRGARLAVAWSESVEKRLNREKNVFEDTYYPDGGTNRFTTSWLRAGRCVALHIRTGAEPLTIRSLAFSESRYPLEISGGFSCDDPTLDPVLKLCRRGLEACAHEGVWDCPYYEQLTYLGDTLVQFLAQNVLSSDDRLQRRCLEIFSASRGTDGMMPMNTPCDGPQSLSGTYTLVYPIHLGNYLTWHTNRTWLAAQVPGLVATMEGLRRYTNAEGLIENLPGWCFIDWSDWESGGTHDGAGPDAGRVSSIENLFYVLALESSERVVRACGDDGLAAVYRARRMSCARAVVAHFWDEERGAIVDGPYAKRLSEHALSLAILADVLDERQRARCAETLVGEADLTRATVYFMHYLFEAYARIGRTDLILKRLDLWREYVRKGYKTPLETPEPSRSDCHGWGAHPLYHLAVNLAGVRPDGDFFSRVRIAPNPASLKKISCRVPHPRGVLVLDLDFADDVSGTVELPEGLFGTFEWKGAVRPLVPGRNDIRMIYFGGASEGVRK